MKKAQRQEDQGRDGGSDITVAVDQEDASRAGMMNPPSRNPQAAWRGRQGVASLANLSTTMPPSGYVPLPGYSDGDAHGGFNPNTTFPHGAPQCSSLTGFGHDSHTPSSAFNVGLNTNITAKKRNTELTTTTPTETMSTTPIETMPTTTPTTPTSPVAEEPHCTEPAV
ncbi:putative methionyl-tRNA synthetase [Hordeum vulgare]|nr:putative methionyl-tRNA synthetase [Hordeum vulgare]